MVSSALHRIWLFNQEQLALKGVADQSIHTGWQTSTKREHHTFLSNMGCGFRSKTGVGLNSFQISNSITDLGGFV